MEAILQQNALILAKAFFQICKFSEALNILKEIRLNETELSAEEFADFFALKIRIYSERMDRDQILMAYSELISNRVQHNINKSSRLNYSLGISEYYMGRIELASNYFKQSLTCSNSDNEKINALLGLASINFDKTKPNIFFNYLNEILPLTKSKKSEGNIACHLFFAKAFLELGEPLKSLEHLDEMKDSCKSNDYIYMSLYALLLKSKCLMSIGNLTEAKLNLNILDSLVDPFELKLLKSQIDHLNESLIGDKPQQKVLFYDQVKKTIIVKPSGKVFEMKNQFILEGLLKLLGNSGAMGISKEKITTSLWNENYAPQIHDNKIYVHIKRLRKLLGENGNESCFIKRTINGYGISSDYIFELK